MATSVILVSVWALLAVQMVSTSLNLFESHYYLKEGLGFFEKVDYQRADSYLKRAVNSDPQSKVGRYYLGIAQYRMGRYPESRKTLEDLIRLDPSYRQSHYWLASSYFRTSDLETAEKEFQESLRVNDMYGPSYYALGNIAHENQESISSGHRIDGMYGRCFRAGHLQYLDHARSGSC